jgi:hypothetical protein
MKRMAIYAFNQKRQAQKDMRKLEKNKKLIKF